MKKLETMNLDQLAVFVADRNKRMAVDAWNVGKAFNLAKEKCKTEDRSFTDWKQQHSFSDAMVSRYSRLYRAYEENPGDLETVGIMEALEALGISRPSRRDTVIEEEGIEIECPGYGEEYSDASQAIDQTVPPPFTRPSWAMDDCDEDQERENGPSVTNVLEVELQRLHSLAQQIHAEWPGEDSEQQRLIAGVKELLSLLTIIVAMAPEAV